MLAPRLTSVGRKSSPVFRGKAHRGVGTFVNTIDGPQKNVIFQGHTLINGNIVLNLDVIPQCHLWSNHHVLTDFALLAHPDAFHDMAEMPDLASVTDLGSLIDVGGFMNKIGLGFTHQDLVSREQFFLVELRI